MRGRALLDGAKEYLGFLVRTAIFPLAWAWAFTVARENERDDPNGRKKVGAAIVAGVVLAAGVGYFLWDFEQDSREGMYDQLDGRLRGAVGEAAYQDQSTIVGSKARQIDIISGNLETARAAGDTANETSLEENLTIVQGEMATAQANKAALEDNHLFYTQQLRPAIAAKDDAAIESRIADHVFDQDVETAIWDAEKVAPRTERAMAIKDSADADMMDIMWYLLYPGVIGVLFAPLFIALGSIMASAWERSETVGFKKYPGAALGLFLLMGAFGWPSLVFASWGLWILVSGTVKARSASEAQPDAGIR